MYWLFRKYKDTWKTSCHSAICERTSSWTHFLSSVILLVVMYSNIILTQSMGPNIQIFYSIAKA
jgi:putative copper export protein